MFSRLEQPLLCSLIVFAASANASFALTIPDYDTALHNRFEAGFPTAPTDNLKPGFIGASQDFTGVAWSTTTYLSNTSKGFAMLSPQHFLLPKH